MTAAESTVNFVAPIWSGHLYGNARELFFCILFFEKNEEEKIK